MEEDKNLKEDVPTNNISSGEIANPNNMMLGINKKKASDIVKRLMKKCRSS